MLNFLQLIELSDDRERSRRDMSMKLKSDIAKGDKPAYERMIYIKLPKEDQHIKIMLLERFVCYNCNDHKRAPFVNRTLIQSTSMKKCSVHSIGRNSHNRRLTL